MQTPQSSAKRTAASQYGGPKRRKVVFETVPTVSLNTRIARALSARLEPKRYFRDNTINLISGNQQLLYLNPFAGISQGTSTSNRVGDQIYVTELEFYVSYRGEASDAFDISFQTNMVKTNASGSFSSSALTYTSGSFPNMNYTGFPTNGPHNDEGSTNISQKNTFLRHPTLTAAGFGQLHHHVHKVKLNRKITYVADGSAVTNADYAFVVGMDSLTTSGITEGSLYCNYIVKFKDA